MVAGHMLSSVGVVERVSSGGVDACWAAVSGASDWVCVGSDGAVEDSCVWTTGSWATGSFCSGASSDATVTAAAEGSGSGCVNCVASIAGHLLHLPSLKSWGSPMVAGHMLSSVGVVERVSSGGVDACWAAVSGASDWVCVGSDGAVEDSCVWTTGSWATGSFCSGASSDATVTAAVVTAAAVGSGLTGGSGLTAGWVVKLLSAFFSSTTVAAFATGEAAIAGVRIVIEGVSNSSQSFAKFSNFSPWAFKALRCCTASEVPCFAMMSPSKLPFVTCRSCDSWNSLHSALSRKVTTWFRSSSLRTESIARNCPSWPSSTRWVSNFLCSPLSCLRNRIALSTPPPSTITSSKYSSEKFWASVKRLHSGESKKSWITWRAEASRTPLFFLALIFSTKLWKVSKRFPTASIFLKLAIAFAAPLHSKMMVSRSKPFTCISRSAPSKSVHRGSDK